ncbi:nuclear transport factor 2 family protein [Curvibacter sp. APW13]|uniref:nuclear transport factor 2 family protein n=1 Tax=Curvibacter sp. APW13 TaxID=3077236 RepID=UPI0028DFE20B|nr:nuclear transport factor 2 family protein [Curvibacter sp. APW13]MDT8990421.1 nuclear transport factor 2 family protein [Curvibacter sp. APW13]
MTTTDDYRSAVERIVQAFETITPQSVAALGDIYTPRAHFKDPFNDVHGLAEVQRIFAHMFVALESPRFVVTRRIVDGSHCFLAWEFRFKFRRFDTTTEQCVLGGSHLQLAPDGRILDHRDYWDAAEELYEKLPLVGALMRWLKKRANT